MTDNGTVTLTRNPFADPKLRDVHGCIDELQNCSQGMAVLDHLYAEVLNDIDQREETFQTYESEAAKEVRLELPKAATATELSAAINAWFIARPAARKARDDFKEAKRRKAKLERWFRSLEKRITAAQTARNAHEHLSKAAG